MYDCFTMTRGSRRRLRLILTAVGLLAVALSGSALHSDSRVRAETISGPPTFAVDVAPIIYGHCVVCHRPDQAAPFTLASYEDVKKRGALIVRATSRRYMPPWHATSTEGFPEFRDDRRLSDGEIATLKAWVDAGMPAGDLREAPSPPSFPDRWALGRPDVELSLPRELEVPADGPDLYRNVVLPLNLAEEKWIRAIDFEPSARKIVHHALFFVVAASDSAGVGTDDVLPGLGLGLLRRGARRGGWGRASFGERAGGGIGGWVPGMTPRFLPDGVALRLPAHSNVVIQLHLHPSGKAEREQGRLALYFGKDLPAKSLTSIQVPPMFGFAMRIDIPPDEKRYTVHDAIVLPVDVEALGARGHAHYLAREMKMTATLPDGTVKGLLWIGDWDFGWQDSYFYKSPVALPRDTRIDVTIAYDNTSDNPRNPNNPPRRVRWGLGSFDEMGSMSLLVAPASEADENALRQAQALHFRWQLAQMLLGRP
jgi:hypothetical protein